MGGRIDLLELILDDDPTAKSAKDAKNIAAMLCDLCVLCGEELWVRNECSSPHISQFSAPSGMWSRQGMGAQVL